MLHLYKTFVSAHIFLFPTQSQKTVIFCCLEWTYIRDNNNNNKYFIFNLPSLREDRMRKTGLHDLVLPIALLIKWGVGWGGGGSIVDMQSLVQRTNSAIYEQFIFKICFGAGVMYNQDGTMQVIVSRPSYCTVSHQTNKMAGGIRMQRKIFPWNTFSSSLLLIPLLFHPISSSSFPFSSLSFPLPYSPSLPSHFLSSFPSSSLSFPLFIPLLFPLIFYPYSAHHAWMRTLLLIIILHFSIEIHCYSVQQATNKIETPYIWLFLLHRLNN